MITISFVGDIMPGGMFHYSTEVIEQELQQFLYSHDVRVGTLEAAIGQKEDYDFDSVKVEGRNNLIYANDDDMDLLNSKYAYREDEHLNIDVVSLANNHVCDFEDGLENIIYESMRRGIKTCGAGQNLQEARMPAVVERYGKKIAFLGYCCGNESMGYVKYATKDEPGVAPLIIEDVIEDIKDCKELYDYVVVLPHWGEEYEYFPFVQEVEYARQMIDAGADAVMGSHTHRIGPMISYKGRPVFFSMGNFMFPDYYMRPPRPVFYPSEEERKGIKRKFGYPFPIDEPRVQVWEPMSRVGMVATVDIESGRYSYKLTRLSQDNVAGFFARWSAPLKRLRMIIMGWCIKSKWYATIFRCYYSKKNYARKALHWIVGALGINFDEPVEL